MNTTLLAAQLLNIVILVANIVLAVVALVRLSRAELGAGQRLGWAALALLVPVLGALAVLLLVPRAARRAQ